ncbi:MAG: hypothetical protein ABFD54_12840 [Armatimonadota bacterium]|nr:hypothetical protein [bacterium]
MSNLPDPDEVHQLKRSEAPQRLDQTSPEIQQRLRTAARILANGAIRAAAKKAQTGDLGCSSGSS